MCGHKHEYISLHQISKIVHGKSNLTSEIQVVIKGKRNDLLLQVIFEPPPFGGGIMQT